MNNQERSIAETLTVQATLEGAGVHLHRGFGFFELPRFDPFLLFDDFSSVHKTDYEAGFPLHPHRGIETVTYVLKGDVAHKDSMGNAGTVGAGDIQWMTAGSGIVHEEMPHGEGGLMGFQLWVNLPHTHKMMPPRYQEIKSEDIEAVEGDGFVVHVIAGTYGDVTGPVRDIVAAPTYLDVEAHDGASITLTTKSDDTAFIYIMSGSLTIRGQSHSKGTIVRFAHDGTDVTFHAESSSRFLFVSGTPLNETIAWHGPIVMNTDAEIRTALEDLRSGNFIKSTKN